MPLNPIQDVFTIMDLDTLKVISDPLRLQILDVIRLANEAGELRTVKQLSETLALPVSKLYYHFSTLEKHGLIEVADIQIISGINEKHYQVCARHLVVDQSLFDHETYSDAQAQAALDLLDSTQAVTRSDFLSLLKAVGTPDELPVRLQQRRAHISRDQVRMTPTQANQFYTSLLALLDEFAHTPEDASAETCRFSLTAVFTPVPEKGEPLL